MNTDAPVGVLDGYKVLDFTQYWQDRRSPG